MLCCVTLIRSGCSRNKSPLGVWDLESKGAKRISIFSQGFACKTVS